MNVDNIVIEMNDKNLNVVDSRRSLQEDISYSKINSNLHMVDNNRKFIDSKLPMKDEVIPNN
jgi:hypothetical protein